MKSFSTLNTAEVEKAIEWQFKIQTYLNAQGLQFMADELVKGINMLVILQERLQKEQADYIDRIHP